MKSISLLLVAAGMLLAGGVSAQSGADLAKTKNCLTCHETEKKKVGPPFKETAAKYKGNKEAAAKLIAALKEGTKHPFKAVASDAELKTLVEYVLAQK